jgi:hypothetical protein
MTEQEQEIFFSRKFWVWHWGPASLLFDGNMGTRVSLHEVKQTGCEADHLLSFSARVNYAWSSIPSPLYVFMAWCLIEEGVTLLLYKFLYDIER